MKIIKIFILVVLFFSLVGFLSEQYIRANAESQNNPIGQLVDVGGHQLHYVKKGVERGLPSVIFEAGLEPGGGLSWYKVQDEISKYTTTLSYDRAGLMWSERGENPKTAENIATELHLLLEKANVKKPYVVVGHSFGGLLLRRFVEKYKDEVSGVVLVDASSTHQNELLGESSYVPLWLVEYLNNVGIVRLMPTFVYPNTKRSEDINRYIKELTFKGLRTTIEETNLFDVIAKEVSTITSFGDIPLSVISASSRSDKVWGELQKDLLKLSTNSKQILSNDSEHYIQLEYPQLIIDIIKDKLNLK